MPENLFKLGYRVSVRSEAEMLELGASLAPHLKAGEVWLLEGGLGAGKTTLVRGILRGLGFTKSVRSPTFNLLHEYATQPRVVHCDLYRVQSGEGLGLEDYVADSLLLIEWPSNLGGVLEREETRRVEIDMVSETERLVSFY